MRIQAAPFYLKNPNSTASDTSAVAKRLSIQINIADYDEEWLQNLIHQNPELLPASTIEPAFGTLVPVCTELPCPSGYLDNLYVTPEGHLVLAECKLWRNPEARRKVIAQVMDYAKDFAAWDYDSLTEAIRKRTKNMDENPLYSIVSADPNASDEITFVDRVSRNLRLGRHLLLVVGDGIRENMVSLTEHVQQHMGLHFTFGLIEMSMYKFPEDDGILVIPNIIAKTTNIERAIIRVEGGSAEITQPVISEETGNAKGRAKSLSEEEFFEQLAENTPAGTVWLKNILVALEGLGMSYEIKRSLLFRYSPDGEVEFGAGYIETSGRFQTGQATWALNKLGHSDIAIDYLNQIVSVVKGAELKFAGNGKEPSVLVNGRTLSIEDLVGKEQEFLAIAEKYIRDIRTFVSDD